MPRLVEEGGNLMSLGIVRRTHAFRFDCYSRFRKKWHLTSSDGTIEEPGRRSTCMALNLIAQREIDVAPMLTRRLPFSRVEEAHELARSRQDGAILIVIDTLGQAPRD
jgi:threonine dehydrogenase-like Zn-dependent dehydrogenase